MWMVELVPTIWCLSDCPELVTPQFTNISRHRVVTGGLVGNRLHPCLPSYSLSVCK